MTVKKSTNKEARSVSYQLYIHGYHRNHHRPSVLRHSLDKAETHLWVPTPQPNSKAPPSLGLVRAHLHKTSAQARARAKATPRLERDEEETEEGGVAVRGISFGRGK